MSADTAEGEFRVPEDVEAEDAARLAEAPDATDDPDTTDEDAGPTPRRRLRFGRRTTTADDAADDDATALPADFSDVDLGRTPGQVVGAVALGVVAAPLLGVYAVLFITRYFLQPGVAPDITSSWTGEGLSGLVAAVLAIAMLVIVGRAAGGKGLPVFVGAQLVVVGACVFLLSDSSYGGRSVTIVVGLLALASAVLAVLPVSRRWFAAHAADRESDRESDRASGPATARTSDRADA